MTYVKIMEACAKDIIETADSCLKRPYLKINKRKGLAHKKWYDCDLKKTKKGTG